MTLSANTYDAIGRLYSKQMMDGDNISYTYNVRNWLTGISSTNFTETLAYNSTINGLTPGYGCYGGDIAAMRWKTSNENFTRGFQFYYNTLGWLTHAYNYKDDDEVNNFYIEYYYDKMGNMTHFWRGGYISEGSYNHIDMPELTLNGNQMTRVDDYDHVLYYPYNKSFHFVDAASQDNEYTYDQNGNMTKDLNRKISSIQYNLLNLPQNMTYSNNRSTTYVYDAMGRKLQVEYVNPATTFDYCGNVIYANGRLYRILVDGGYIEPYEGEMYYSYYLKDHQGNNRVVAYDNGVVDEVNHYYPFGLLFGESEDPETQRFKFNGKEFDRYHGLDMYDYGARFYDPGICRFTTMDPMCEKYYHLSPYIYCGNNPVNAIDIKGDTITYNYQGLQYNYIMKGDQSGFYDTQGNMLNEPNAYELTSALKTIQSGKEGYNLINSLCISSKIINIAIDNENKTTYNRGTIYVKWNSSDFSGAGLDELNSVYSPPFIPLAHELIHAKDYEKNGKSNQDIWYIHNGKSTNKSEYYTCIRENLIRAEHGLPFRRYYSVSPNNVPYKPSLIPIYSVMPISTWNTPK